MSCVTSRYKLPQRMAYWELGALETGSEMIEAVLQVVVLCLLLSAVALWAFNFPYPSPLVRWWMPPRHRWPEALIRDWLANGRFHPAFLNYFNRDPERTPPPGDSILAPADGIITGTEIRDGTRYIVIALSFWDMHVQRTGVAGRVTQVEAQGDTFMDEEGQNFAFLRDKRCPVQKRIVLDTAWGQIAVRLITSLAARRIETWVREGDDVQRGQRIGRILLGSTVVLELPASAEVRVQIGERVFAGETPIADALPSADSRGKPAMSVNASSR